MTCLWSKNLNGQLCELFQAQYSLVILYRRKQIKCGHHHLQSSCIILTGNYSNIPDQMHLKTKQNAVDCYNYLFFNYALKVILLTCTILNFNITISRLNTNRISYNLKKKIIDLNSQLALVLTQIKFDVLFPEPTITCMCN